MEEPTIEGDKKFYLYFNTPLDSRVEWMERMNNCVRTILSYLPVQLKFELQQLNKTFYSCIIPALCDSKILKVNEENLFQNRFKASTQFVNFYSNKEDGAISAVIWDISKKRFITRSLKSICANSLLSIDSKIVAESLQTFCVVANQSINTQKYANGKAYLLSNNTKMCFEYDACFNRLTRLADKTSRMGFHKAVMIERRNKPFIYAIGGFCNNYGYCVTEKYHVTKNIWKRIAPKTVDNLVNMSLYYHENNDTLYAFGGIKFPCNSTKIVSSNTDKSEHKKFAVQKLKIKGSDERSKWDAIYFKMLAFADIIKHPSKLFRASLPVSNLYINIISENSLIIFGQPLNEYENNTRCMGFYHTQFDELEDFQDDILYLEEHGLDDSEDEKEVDSLDKNKENLKDFEKIINIEDKVEEKSKLKKRPSRDCQKSFPNNNYFISDRFIHAWCEDESLIIFRVSKPGMIPSIKKTYIWN